MIRQETLRRFREVRDQIADLNDEAGRLRAEILANAARGTEPGPLHAGINRYTRLMVTVWSIGQVLGDKARELLDKLPVKEIVTVRVLGRREDGRVDTDGEGEAADAAGPAGLEDHHQ